MGSLEPVHKKQCLEERTLTNGINGPVAIESEAESALLQPIDVMDGQQPVLTMGNKLTPCIKFFSTSGCAYGEGCHFSHLGTGNNTSVNFSGLCPASTAAVDPSLTINAYKTRLCNRYTTPEGCRFADKCHFAHGEYELRRNVTRISMDGFTNSGVHAGQNMNEASDYAFNGLIQHPYNPLMTSLYYGEPSPPGVTTTAMPRSTAKVSIEASLAGAIIGRAGSNVRQISRLTGAKISIREHETDSRFKNVEIEGLPDQIQLAREMVRQFLQTREVAADVTSSALGSHNYKSKLCDNFLQGTCTFGERCHFAHGESELQIAAATR